MCIHTHRHSYTHAHVLPPPHYPLPSPSIIWIPLIHPTALSEWVVYTMWLKSSQHMKLYRTTVSPQRCREWRPVLGGLCCTNLPALGNSGRALHSGLWIYAEKRSRNEKSVSRLMLKLHFYIHVFPELEYSKVTNANCLVTWGYGTWSSTLAKCKHRLCDRIQFFKYEWRCNDTQH